MLPRGRLLRCALCVALGATTGPSCSSGERELSVFTAASLGGAMEEAARAFEAETPGARVRVVTGGSQILRRQIEAGAPADLFVPASPDHAEALGDRLEPARTLACNEPVIVVPAGSSVRRIDDLARIDRLVVGTPEVPIGAYTDRVLAGLPAELRARITARIASRELDVRQVLSKVLLGEADAAIVYRTDAAGAGERVRIVTIDPDINVSARSVIAIVRESRRRDAARAFADFLASAGGRALLASRGFTECGP